jgi:hypothetical protein
MACIHPVNVDNIKDSDLFKALIVIVLMHYIYIMDILIIWFVAKSSNKKMLNIGIKNAYVQPAIIKKSPKKKSLSSFIQVLILLRINKLYNNTKLIYKLFCFRIAHMHNAVPSLAVY